MKLLSFWTLGLLTVFCAKPVMAQLTSTNLPIVIVSTSGAIGNTQVQGTMNIIDNASGVNAPTDPPKFSGMVGVNLRGDTSRPKKLYSIETWSSPTVSLDTALLGMPSENDWVLLGSYEDRSLLRNTLSLRIHDKMDRYASRQKYCEVIVNNQYMGIYTFGEKIKRDSLRLDIANLQTTDNSGVELTGGYILKIDGGGDGWVSTFNPPYGTTQQIKFEYEYPSAGDITPVQKAYIKSYVDSFEIALNGANFQDTILGWRRHGAQNSFMDYMIVQEVAKNNEAYRKNTFLYKDKETKLRPGPLWAFELAWKNTSDCNSSKDTGWCYNYGGVCATANKLPPFWWAKLSTDTQFMEELKCRYTNYRKPGNVLDTAVIFQYIDSVNSYLNVQNAVTRNFTKWPIWGVPIVNEPTPMATNYAGELANLKAFVKARIAWLDSKWISTSPLCYPTALTDVNLDQHVSIYPNPSHDQLYIQIDPSIKGNFKIDLHNVQGVLLNSYQTTHALSQIDLSGYAAGVYFLSVGNASGRSIQKVIKQ